MIEGLCDNYTDNFSIKDDSDTNKTKSDNQSQQTKNSITSPVEKAPSEKTENSTLDEDAKKRFGSLTNLVTSGVNVKKDLLNLFGRMKRKSTDSKENNKIYYSLDGESIPSKDLPEWEKKPLNDKLPIEEILSENNLILKKSFFHVGKGEEIDFTGDAIEYDDKGYINPIDTSLIKPKSKNIDAINSLSLDIKKANERNSFEDIKSILEKDLKSVDLDKLSKKLGISDKDYDLDNIAYTDEKKFEKLELSDAETDLGKKFVETANNIQEQLEKSEHTSCETLLNIVNDKGAKYQVENQKEAKTPTESKKSLGERLKLILTKKTKAENVKNERRNTSALRQH